MVDAAALRRAAVAAGAATGIGAAATLALQHPIAPLVAGVFVLACLGVAAWRPNAGLFLVTAGLPFVDFAPWTGAIGVGEFDLLVLAVAGAAWARLAWQATPSVPAALPRSRLQTAFGAAALAFALLSVVGLWRGVVAAGGPSFGWFQGYTEPLNGWRVFKSLAGVALLWLPLRQAIRLDAPRATASLADGMLFGIAVVGIAVIRERAAFPGLLNFSGPYRATALFWEMHVGGAAIDAYLALATPFVVWAVWSAQSRWRWCIAAAVALLTGYACLTTFARGLYLAVAVPLLLLGVVGATRQVGPRVHTLLLRNLAIGAALLCAAVALSVALEAGAPPAVGVLVVALAATGMVLGRVWYRPVRHRSLAVMALVLALLLEVVAVLGLGTYMRERIAASENDLGSRVAHWRAGLGLMRDASDWLLGIGIGRLPAEYATRVPRGEFPGTVRFLAGAASAPAQGSVLVFGPASRNDIRGLLALTQRVDLSPGRPHRVELDVRVERASNVLLQVCEMHLLYPRECQQVLLRLRPEPLRWRHIGVNLPGPSLSAGEPGWPRGAVFAIAVLNAGGAVELDQVRLRDPGGRELLANGDFSHGLARWLPAARSHFLPWHIDNLYLELLVERGVLATVALGICVALALVCLLGRRGRSVAIAPFLAASLCGALCVGMVSSVMDVPRVAFLMLLLLVLAVELTGADAGAGSPNAGGMSS